MFRIADVKSDIKSNSVSVEIFDGREEKMYKILASDFADLPFSCKKNMEYEDFDENYQNDSGILDTPTNSFYEGDKIGFLSFLSKKFKIYNSAVSKIAAADITRKGLIRKLVEVYRTQNIDRELLISLCELVVDKFVEQGYINDYKYAFERAKYQKQNNHCGKQKIKNYLYTKGVEYDTINDVLENEEFSDFSGEILFQLKKKFKKSDITDRKSYMKVVASLGRQGFSYDEIKSVLDDYVDYIDDE